MTPLFEVDSLVLVEVGGRQSVLNSSDLVAFEVQFGQHAVVALSSQFTTT